MNLDWDLPEIGPPRVPRRRGSPLTWNSGSTWARQDSDHRARSDLAIAKPSPAAAEEFARLWPEADAALRIATGAP